MITVEATSLATTSLAAASDWTAQDPDPQTREELDTLIRRVGADPAGSAAAELADRFAGRLSFGTAGLRGVMGAGPNRMNRVVVQQTARGIAEHLCAVAARPTTVVGYDGRRNSRVFAQDVAQILAGSGIATVLLPRPLPTPVLAFAVRELHATAGIMVTASHNPAQDNGLKVFRGQDSHGSQIVPPEDGQIAAAIHAAARTPIAEYPRSTGYDVAPESLVQEYIRRTAGRAGEQRVPLRYVYTAMHGVGHETTAAVLKHAGLPLPVVVVEQRDPDPDFPTVAFPNPEEPGALDLAFATAEAADATLVIAHDPDADRLAVAVRLSEGWRRLTGNEVGLLLGWRAASRHHASDDGRGVLVASIVSTPGLSEIARTFDLDYEETLTGFKWISRVAGIVFGFEEALGYLVDPDKVRDKDGISAAVDFLALTTELTAQGLTIEQHLDQMADIIGGFGSVQRSFRTSSPATIMRSLRESPPTMIGPEPVCVVEDLTGGTPGLPPTDALRFTGADGTRVIVRPSGTEPKLKAYIDVRTTAGTGATRRRTAQRHAEHVANALDALLTQRAS